MQKGYHSLLMYWFTAILCLLKIRDVLSHLVPCLDYSSKNFTLVDDCAYLQRGHSSQCLNLANNSLENLPGNLATCFPEVTQIDICFNKFTQLPYRSLAGLDHLHYLRADGNLIPYLENGCRPLTNLTRISVISNDIQHIPSNLLGIFPDLREGDFSKNSITDVPEISRLCHHRDNDVYLNLTDNPLKNLHLKHFVEDECVTHVTVDDSKMVISTETPDRQRIFSISHNSKTISCDQVIGTNHPKLDVSVRCVHPNGTRDRLAINMSRFPITSSMTSDKTVGHVNTTPTSSSSAVYSPYKTLLCCLIVGIMTLRR